MSGMSMGAKNSHAEPSKAEAESSGSKDDITYCGFDISALPEELLFHVLMFVPAEDVAKRCSCVCKHWLALCKDQSFWRRKCEQQWKYVPSIMGLLSEDFKVLYFKNPYGQNLLRNTHAESFEHWATRHSYRRMLSVETHPAGSDAIKDYVPAAEIEGDKVQNWVTSYQYNEMHQTVSLLERGCAEKILDELKPHIYASAWCSARWDCGSKFYLNVKLLDQNKDIVDSVEKEFNMTDGALRRQWHKVEHTFTSYKPGVRSIMFCMGGVDTQFWAGNYGSKFTLPCLRFVFQPNRA